MARAPPSLSLFAIALLSAACAATPQKSPEQRREMASAPAASAHEPRETKAPMQPSRLAGGPLIVSGREDFVGGAETDRVAGEPRIARNRLELGELAAQVPPSFPFESASIAIVPGRGLPECCESVPRQAEGSYGERGDRIAGATLHAVFVRRAPALKSRHEERDWETAPARLIRVPRSVQRVVLETREEPGR